MTQQSWGTNPTSDAPQPPPVGAGVVPHPKGFGALSTGIKGLIIGAVAIVGILLVVLIAGAAGGGGSGPDAFMDELQSEGFYNRGGDSAQLALGYDVCESLEDGYSRESVIEMVYVGNNLSPAESEQFVDIADDKLC